MGLYRIYIDEVGNHDLEHADDPNERFLSLTGVIIESSHCLDVIQPEMQSMKRTFFQVDPDEPIILHRKELLNKRFPFASLRDPKVEAQFNIALLEVLARWEYVVITVVIDKQAHRNKYRVWHYHPYHYCLGVTLERYVQFLEAGRHRGDVMVEARGGREDSKLKESYARLYHGGTLFVPVTSWQAHLTSAELKVKPKTANIAGLQVADLLAHPSRRQVLLEHGFMQHGPATFGDRITAVLEGKYYRSERTGKVSGYGRKLLP